MKKLLLRIYDTIFDRPACFRVIYLDGERTYRMRHSHAVNLIDNFGGRLDYDPPEYPTKEVRS